MKRVTPVEVVVDDDIPVPDKDRMRRLRGLAWLLDRSIPIGKNRRFGIDPLIGLIPGVGDWIASMLSLYVFYEAARLGLPWRVLGRIAANIGIEALIGSIPVAGDAFDFVYQANMRNLKLVEQNYRPTMKPRPVGRFIAVIIAAAIALLFITIVLAVLVARGIWSLFT